MIKIKYTINDNDITLYNNSKIATVNIYDISDINTALKDAYILANWQSHEGEMPTDAKDYHKPQSSPTLIKNIDFYNLTADVYDQYGDEMDITPTFTIEGEHAKIENGKLIEDAVDSDTSYFIVAKVGDLEQRQERTIYAPREVELTEIDILNKKVERLASENEAKDDLLQEIILQMYL